MSNLIARVPASRFAADQRTKAKKPTPGTQDVFGVKCLGLKVYRRFSSLGARS